MNEKEKICIGERLKNLRESSGKTQKQIADYLEITSASYCYYEKGQREPSLNIITRLAEYFRVPIDFLVTGKMNFTDRTGLSEEAIDRLKDMNETNEDVANCADKLISSDQFCQAVTHLACAYVMETQKTESIKEANTIEGLNTFGLLGGKKSMENKGARASQRMIQEWYLHRAKEIIYEAFDNIVKEGSEK